MILTFLKNLLSAHHDAMNACKKCPQEHCLMGRSHSCPFFYTCFISFYGRIYWSFCSCFQARTRATRTSSSSTRSGRRTTPTTSAAAVAAARIRTPTRTMIKMLVSPSCSNGHPSFGQSSGLSECSITHALSLEWLKCMVFFVVFFVFFDAQNSLKDLI